MVSCFMNSKQKGKYVEGKLMKTLYASEKFNNIRKSSHRDFSTRVEQIANSLCV